MYKDVLRALSGIEILPVLAFVIFFAFFLGLLVYVARLKKGEVQEMAAIPLQEQEPIHPRTSYHPKS